MAVPLSVECHGKNYIQRLPPMAPLSNLIPGVLKQAGLDSKVNPDDCKLFIKDKILDQTLAVRFANIPATAKIIVKTGHEPVLGVIEPPPTTTTTTTRNPLPPQPHGQNHADHTHPSRTETQPQPQHTTHSNDTANKEREIHVFSRQEEVDSMARHVTTTAADLDEDAYEVTERDLRLILAGYAAKKAQEERGLMTRQVREAEIARKLAEYGPVPIRVEFPDGMIVQSMFEARSTVSDVYDMVRSVLIQELSSICYLFTAPPKVELKDMKATLYGAGLVPAARVHVGFKASTSGGGGSQGLQCLKEEVMAKAGAPPSKGLAGRHQGGDAVKGENESAAGEKNPSNSVAEGGHLHGGSQKKGNIPKWLKLSK